MKSIEDNAVFIDVKGFRESKKFSLRAFGDDIGGISSSYLSRVERGEMPLSKKFVMLLSERYSWNDIKDFVKVDVGYDIFEVKKMFVKKTSKNTESNISYYPSLIYPGKPLLKSVQESKLNNFPQFDLVDCFIPATGLEMSPEVKQSDIIGLKKMTDWFCLDTSRIYLIITKTDKIIKYIEYGESDEYIFCSSPGFSKFKVRVEDIVEIHRVVFVVSGK